MGSTHAARRESAPEHFDVPSLHVACRQLLQRDFAKAGGNPRRQRPIMLGAPGADPARGLPMVDPRSGVLGDGELGRVDVLAPIDRPMAARSAALASLLVPRMVRVTVLPLARQRSSQLPGLRWRTCPPLLMLHPP
jgi:hypothetical protein